MRKTAIVWMLFMGCAAEKSFSESMDSGFVGSTVAEHDTETGDSTSSVQDPISDSLKGDSVMHIELDPSCVERPDTGASTPNEPQMSETPLQVSNVESELSTAQSAFIAYFEGDLLWIEHRGANASCAEDWRGVTAYFEGDVFYVDYDLQGLGGCVYAVSYSLELAQIAPSLVNNQLYRVEAGGDIQYAQYEVVSVDYPD